MSIFSCARVLSIQHGIKKQGTPDRLIAARALQEKMHDIFDNLVEAHRIIFNTILQQQLIDIEAGIPLSNNVDPELLNGSKRKQLKWALERVPGVSNLLGDPLSSV